MENPFNSKQDANKTKKYFIRILPDEDSYRENIIINTQLCPEIIQEASRKITFTRKKGSLFEETLFALESLKFDADELDQKANNQSKMLSLQYGEEVKTKEIEAKIHELEAKNKKPKALPLCNYKDICLVF